MSDAGESSAASSFEAFDRLARRRRATRHFRADPIPAGLLDRIIDAARWAPSGYNLQPTHFVVVTDPATRDRLWGACMRQAPIREAPAVVVLTGDSRVASAHFEDVLRMENEAGSMTSTYEATLRRIIPLAFGRGPAGLGWLWKWLLLPIARWFIPVPSVPAVATRYWLAKQVMLCAMALMLGAQSAGLSTLPIEGFDESRVRRALGIPRTQVIPVIIAVGYAEPQDMRKTRLPIERLIHRDRW